MKFSKEDIQRVTKTSPIEDSLLVFQADGAKRKYVEYALVKIDEVILHVSDISRWIDAVPRFRDCYIYENNQPVQIRLKSAFYPVQIIELEGEQSMKSVMGQLTNLVPVIDVQSPPLFEVVAFHSGSDTYLGLAYHHLLLDGISAQLALSMLDPNHRFQASDWLPNPAPAKSDVPHLPSFLIEPLLPPPVAQAPGFLRLQHRIEGGSYEEVMIQWVDFIQQASGSDEVVVGEVLSARDDSVEAQQALGYFVQTWPLVFQGATHLEQLKSIRNERIAVSQDWVNRHVPSQCFDHVWVVEPTLGSRHESLFWSTPHYPLTLVIKPSEAHVDIEFCWNLEKVDARAAQQIFASFGAHLEEPEAVQSLPEWPAPSSPNLLALWDLSVAAHADRVAVEDAQGNQWTYRELDRRAEALASRLPVNPGDRIGVHVTHSAAIPLAFLGVLKRGGTYVPIDPTVTRERWEYILEDAGIELVVSDLSDSLGRVAVHPNERVDADMVPYEAHVPDPTEAVYLIYTSGTTGQPKGCAVNHLNLANLFEGTQEYFGFHPKDRWVLAHSYGFDFSTWEIWGCLLSGGQLFIPPRKTIQDTFSFYDYLKEEGITILNQTPKAFDNLMLVDESSTGLPSIRHVVFGGDKLHPERLSDWIARHKACVLTNMYGITETTVHVTAKQVVQETQSNIGRPLPGYTLRWVNDSGQAIPKGFIGEMHVFGNGVCNGYHGKPELTNEKFGLQHSNRFYRTGDLGWQVGEDAYYLGRKDRQIKVRGYRIELGEIEFQLQKSAPGCQFIAALHEDQLVAFFKGNTPGFDPEFFQGKLADYAIPHRFIHVTEFPLNASGKVDEKTLFAHLSERTTAASAAQGDPFIVQAVQETLGDGISMERTFIQNGGDSIAAIRVINKLRKAERTLQVSELFETHAIAQLRSAPLVADSKSMQSALELFHKKAALDWSDDQFYIPLLEAQEGILFDCLRSDDPSLYVEQLTYELPGTYGFDQIQKAYQAVCHHNPILTARLDRHVGQYLLKADRNAPVVCTEITSSEWKDYLQEDFARGFELERNLTRIAVLPGKDQTRLVWTHHHLILDGWSLGVFSNEMMKALENKTLLAHDEFIQLACECSNHPQAGTYWARKSLPQLATALPPPLPSKDPELAYLKHRVFIPLADASRIQETGTSMHAYCMTLWASFLCTLYDRSEVLLGNVVSLRSDEHLEALGMFVRTLPFIFHADRNRSFEQLLQDTAERLREDEQHKGERLGEHTQGHLNDHLFVFENYPVDHAALEEKGIRIGDFQERTGSPWTTLVYPVPGGVEWHVLFHPAHHNRNQVQSVLTHFERWAQALNWTQPCTVLKSALLLEPAIIGRTLPRQELKILELLKRDSNQPAILGTDFDMTYSDLWAEAELLANSLCQAGLEAREAVGIDVACTRHFAASILGVWRAGGVPAPVDKRYPASRKAFVYEAVSARFVLQTDANDIELVATNHPINPLDDSAGFILSTSGSTGTPKVVVQTHACLINLVHWNRSSFGMKGDDVILQSSSFGFDASFHEVLLAMSLGASLVELPLESRLDIHQIKASIQAHAVTQAWIPARLLNAVLEADIAYFDACNSLKRIVTTGEALILSIGLKNYLQQAGVSLLNYYGPTETHVVTALEVTAANIRTQPPIGTVLDNCQICLMNDEGQPAFKGLPGEIWVTGDPVALGYHNEDALNAAVFINQEGKRWYKTGDWGYVGDNNLLEFIGRKDSQLNIRGFRVEPIEVERTLMEIPGLTQCCVLTQDQELYAFVVGVVAREQLIEESRGRLPDYMVPSHWHVLDGMPLNSNGKADRKALVRLMHSTEVQNIKSTSHWQSTRAWRQTLGHDQFGDTSSFESVGGNSILLMKLQAWIEKELGIFVSVRDLLLHKTPESLEMLLRKEPISSEVLPEHFPVHSLQRAILILEAGQNLEGHSPFWLGFKAQLSKPVAREAWEQAVETLLDQYPHLKVALQGTSELKQIQWVQVSDIAPFLTSIPANPSTYENALVRFIHHGTTEIEIQWHHVLLDGLGTEVLLRNLKEILDGQFQKRHLPLHALLQPQFDRSAPNVRTSGAKAQVCKTELASETLEAVSAFCLRHELRQSTFWQFLAAYAHEISEIAIADVAYHPGFPGMFTELKAIRFDLNAESPTKWVMPESAPDGEFSVVANFMTLMTDNDWVQHLDMSEPTHCKYPHEWQFIVSGSQVDVAYYSAQNDVQATQTFGKFQTALEQLLTGAPLKSPESSAALDVFDEFNF